MRYLLFAFSFFLVTSVLCQSCKEEVTSARSMLVAADSMMWSNPDSALLVLEQIPDSRELRGEERALYALLLTQARYKSCVLLENDSLLLSEISDKNIESTPNLRNMATNLRRSFRKSSSASHFVMVRAEYFSFGKSL